MKPFILTPDQEQWFRDHFYDTPLSELKAYLHCSAPTIYRLARTMGLKRLLNVGNKIYLSAEQQRYLVSHFAYTKNEELASHLGVSLRTVTRNARALGLVKSPEFIKQAQAGAAAGAKRYFLLHGPECQKNRSTAGIQKYQFRPGETMADRIGEDRAREVYRRITLSRNDTIRKERARVTFGLPQKTSLRVVRQPREKVLLRYALKKRGYHIDEEERIAYYGPSTHRSSTLEAKPQPWFRFLTIPQNPLQHNE